MTMKSTPQFKSLLQGRLVLSVAMALAVLSLAACAPPTSRTENGTPSNGSTRPTLTIEGTINGGGGVGVRCGGKLSLLEKYEADQAGMDLIDEPKSVAEGAKILADLFAEHNWNPETIPMPEYNESLLNLLILPVLNGTPFKDHSDGTVYTVRFVDQQLVLSNDYGHIDLAPNCHLEQVAYFSDSKTTLWIDRVRWNELDLISKLMLVTHELMYFVDRKNGLETLIGATKHTSEVTRRFVKALFSKKGLPKKTDGLDLSQPVLACATAPTDPLPTYFYISPRANASDLKDLIFKTILDHSSFYQLKSWFRGASGENDVVLAGAKLPAHFPDLSVRVRDYDGTSGKLQFFVTRGSSREQLKHEQSFTCRLWDGHLKK